MNPNKAKRITEGVVNRKKEKIFKKGTKINLMASWEYLHVPEITQSFELDRAYTEDELSNMAHEAAVEYAKVESWFEVNNGDE